jgi:hypothetical protein
LREWVPSPGGSDPSPRKIKDTISEGEFGKRGEEYVAAQAQLPLQILVLERDGRGCLRSTREWQRWWGSYFVPQNPWAVGVATNISAGVSDPVRLGGHCAALGWLLVLSGRATLHGCGRGHCGSRLVAFLQRTGWATLNLELEKHER